VKSILPREAASEEIVAAMHAAHTGLVLLDPAIAQQIVERVGSATTQIPTSYENLTPRENEVLAMLAEGLANREIADRLGVSDHTIKFHISSILDKLGASTRTEAVTLGLRMGLIVL
jgi:two-component system, NarL family, response regulator YdfI